MQPENDFQEVPPHSPHTHACAMPASRQYRFALCEWLAPPILPPFYRGKIKKSPTNSNSLSLSLSLTFFFDLVVGVR